MQRLTFILLYCRIIYNSKKKKERMKKRIPNNSSKIEKLRVFKYWNTIQPLEIMLEIM